VPHRQRLTDRLSYANVMATFALFISLGGASYAVVALPPHSVGARQLRTGAVTPPSLSFPLGVKAVTDSAAEDLRKTGCNSPRAPGEPPIKIVCPSPALGGAFGPSLISITARRQGHMLISGIVGTNNEGGAATEANVTYDVVLDGKPVVVREVRLGGGEHEQVPVQALARVARGPHHLDVREWATYSSYGPGDVVVTPVSLVAVLLP
jgi:hypothetical protein